MAKAIIPIYDICTIDQQSQKDLLIDRFGSYLEKHYHNLHLAHRHSFYHLVLFAKGGGTHTIDFEKFTVKPYQIYFMVPGKVHSWHFEKQVDDTSFTSMLHCSPRFCKTATTWSVFLFQRQHRRWCVPVTRIGSRPGCWFF